MANRDLITVGTSAGGVAALLEIARGLPADLPAAILVSIHMSPLFRSELDVLLNRVGPLRASFAEDGEPCRPQHIYIAPPDRHLLVIDERLRLGKGPRENNARPAIDPMLRSAAVCCGSRSIGAVLTGTLGDGASGLLALSQCGGISIVQNPVDAAFSEMPLNALDRVRPDHVAKLAEIPGLLARLAQEPAGEPVRAPASIAFEVSVAMGDERYNMDEMDRIGRRSVLTCPDCQGVMWEIDEGDLLRFRCHVGHAYTAELMSIALDENLRRALAGALRALEERLALARKLQNQAERDRLGSLAANWMHKVEELQENLDVIRAAIHRIDDLRAREGAAEASP